MRPGQASRTALLVAAHRARATAAEPRICDDPWAAALAGREGTALAERFAALQPHMQLWIALRTAFLDAAVSRLLSNVRQVVILGAGLDTRAARLGRPGVRFFEVDAPDSQDDKLARLRQARGYPVDAARYVRCDFEHEDFLERLLEAGFDASQPAAIVWEGVSYYLTEGIVRRTLRRMADGCHPSTTVLFDYVGKRIADGTLRDVEDAQMRQWIAELGEPFRWGTNDVLPLLYEEGFRRVRVTSFDEIALELTGTYDRARKFRFQFIAEASRAPMEQP